MMEFFNAFINFVKILLFAETVLLTGHPIDIEKGENELVFQQSQSALNERAEFNIDVTAIIGGSGEMSNISTINAAQERFSKGFLKGDIEFQDKTHLSVVYKGGVAVSRDRVYLVLEPNGSFPEGKKFREITLVSDRAIPNVMVYWKNYGL